MTAGYFVTEVPPSTPPGRPTIDFAAEQERKRLHRQEEAEAEQRRQAQAVAEAEERRREAWIRNRPQREAAQAALEELAPRIETTQAELRELLRERARLERVAGQ